MEIEGYEAINLGNWPNLLQLFAYKHNGNHQNISDPINILTICTCTFLIVWDLYFISNFQLRTDVGIYIPRKNK